MFVIHAVEWSDQKSKSMKERMKLHGCWCSSRTNQSLESKKHIRKISCRENNREKAKLAH